MARELPAGSTATFADVTDGIASARAALFDGLRKRAAGRRTTSATPAPRCGPTSFF